MPTGPHTNPLGVGDNTCATLRFLVSPSSPGGLWVLTTAAGAPYKNKGHRPIRHPDGEGQQTAKLAEQIQPAQSKAQN